MTIFCLLSFICVGIVNSFTGISNNLSGIQIDAAPLLGNSGGPISNDLDKVVGVAEQKLDLKNALKNFGTKTCIVSTPLRATTSRYLHRTQINIEVQAR